MNDVNKRKYAGQKRTSISSMPSWVHQCKNTILLNMAANCSQTAVEVLRNVTAVLRPCGRMSHPDTKGCLGA